MRTTNLWISVKSDVLIMLVWVMGEEGSEEHLGAAMSSQDWTSKDGKQATWIGIPKDKRDR